MAIPIFERWGLNQREQRMATIGVIVLGTSALRWSLRLARADTRIARSERAAAEHAQDQRPEEPAYYAAWVGEEPAPGPRIADRPRSDA